MSETETPVTDESRQAEQPPEPRKRPWNRPWDRLPARLRAAVTLPRLLLALIAAGAATGYAWSLHTAGLETYYAAGVHSMAGSWHAFFFDAFDPHATITLDKLPGAFWIQALSVRCFGFSPWALVLPQVIEGTLTVLVLYRAVRRTAGTAAALTAAALLAASPITISSTRGNLSDPLYLLCIVLAADAALRAVTTGRRRSWYAAGAWVAAAFQAKMTEAWLVLPILALVLVMAAPSARRKAAVRAGIWVLATAAASLVWVCSFALSPAADRPYADGSTNNSIFAQVFVYNGELRFGASGYIKPLAKPSAEAYAVALENREVAPGYVSSSDLTKPGWDRLLTGPLAPDTGWFLLPAVGGAAAAYYARRRAGRGDPARAAIVLWSGWLLGYGAAFSGAERIQSYYLATLIPAEAALAATGIWVLLRSARAGNRRSGVFLSLLIVAQAAWASWMLRNTYPWLSILILCAAVIASAAALPKPRRTRATLRIAVAVATLAMLAGPVGAGVWLSIRAAGPFDNVLAPTGTLAEPTPAAKAARAQIVGGYGGTIHAQYTEGQWAEYMGAGPRVQRELNAAKGDLLVFSSAEAADNIMFGETSVLPVGGFTGDVPYPSVAQLQQMIRSGKIAFAIVPNTTVATGNDPRVQLVEQSCRLLTESIPAAGYDYYSCFLG